jgi:molecular chaperone GrpE
MTNGYNNGHGQAPDPEQEEAQPDIIVDFETLSADEQVAILRRDLDAARDDLVQTREQVQRIQADMANYRRRSEEEQAAFRQDANRRLIMNLLPVVDELELAINHLSDNDASAPWVEGVKLIHRKAYGVLESEGLSKIETVGVQFDPLQHEAVGVVDSEEQPSGYVVEAIRNGYKLRDRVIQAAQVVVAR